MALGSVAIVSIGDDPDDTPPDDGDDMDAVSATLDVDPDFAGIWQQDGDDALNDGRSLFDRMGLINMFDDAPSDIGAADPAQADESQGVAEVLKLHGFRLQAEDGLPESALPPDGTDPDGVDSVDWLDYDAVEDQLLIVFDDSGDGPEPELELRIREDDPDTTEIRLGDRVLAILPTDEAPPLSSIILVGESDAAALGLAA